VTLMRGGKNAKHLDQNRAQAEQCRQLAFLAPNGDDKAYWLRLAENPARLIELVADIGRPGPDRCARGRDYL
jgi:hypothetical protein